MQIGLALSDFRQVSRETLHSWAVWHLERGVYESPDSETFERCVVRSPGAVAVVPVLSMEPDPKVVLVGQYRPALDRYMLELPAGMRDVEGEDGPTTARRELQEETGYNCAEVIYLGSCASAPGITDSQVVIYLGLEISQGTFNRHGPEETFMEVEIVNLDSAIEMVCDGRINDAKTMVGLFLAREKLREQR